MVKHHLEAKRKPQSVSRRNIFALVLGIGLTIVLAFAGVQQLIAQGPQPRSPQGVPLPTGFTYQGQLKNANGPVNGQCNLAFRLYDDPGAGTQIGSAITQTVPITGGVFTTALDFGAGALNGDARWLEIRVSTTCPAGGSFTTLSPRQALSAAPYALFSAAPWVTSVGNLYYNGGKVGIGISSPANLLHVYATSPVTNAVVIPMLIESHTTGPVANGFGTALSIGGQFLGGQYEAARISAIETDFSDGHTDIAIAANQANVGLTEYLRIKDGGNVGIGTTTPADRLSVAGVVATTGGVRFPDGTLQTTAARKGQNVIVVAKSAGDFTTITAALASIVNASATNHYLIYVAPGTYTETVAMQPYVDIEGAGELTTKITQVGSAAPNTGTVVGASNAELRFLSVENTGGTPYAIAIYNSGASPRLTHVTSSAAGATTTNIGMYNTNSPLPTMTNVTASASGGTTSYAVSNDSSSPAMTNVTASASGGTYNDGVFNYLSSPTINNSAISASGGSNSNGIQNSAGIGSYTLNVNNSQVSGSTHAVSNGTGFTTLIGASQLGGGVVSNAGTLTCVVSYSGSYVALNSTCQ